MKAIETKNLTKYYGKSRGIIDVSLSVESGDFFGFIGPNGAGKSTFIRVLLGLISATSGNFEIFGKSSDDKISILSNVGYLPSETNFYNMTVAELISLSAKLRGTDCSTEAKLLCERLDLDTSKKIDTLSLGNKKKVGIVCALQHKPSLYVLDEPTSGLDPLIQKEFYTILKERNEEGATVFLSSHALWEIEKYCKNAAVIKEGKIVVCDSVKKLSCTGIKKVSLKGVAENFSFDGAFNLKIEKRNADFLFGGSSKELIKNLSTVEFSDFTVSDPELDEVFMHYYKEEN